MSLRNSGPISFSPTGVTDTLDGTNAPQGSMGALVNLIPDPTTAGLFICRPASELLTDFTGFTTPGFISVLHVSGSLIYGMIATGLVAGHDQPFCYNITTGAFIAVGGVQNAATLPTSPATSGAWVPPIMDLIGTFLVVAHPGFPGGAGAFFGWFDVTNPAAPTWNVGNTAPVALLAVPKSVAQFNGRAWFAVGNNLVFSDVLLATTVTNASQVLTLGDNLDVTALAALPLNSALTGGISQALIVFKGATIMYQIMGDATTSNLSVNAFTTGIGTLAPNTIQQTPEGIAFVSPQGVRVLTTQMNISDPIGAAGSGVALPFIYAVEPSRMCAAYNADVYRVSVKNGIAIGTPTQEWWFDKVRKVWTGPHTFPASYIHGFTDAGNGASFVEAPDGVTGKLFNSRPVPSLTPVYTENGTALTYLWTTSPLMDTNQMSESYVTEATLKMSLVEAGGPVTVSMIDESASIIQSVLMMGVGTRTIWNHFTWGGALWRGGPAATYRPRRIPFTEQGTFRMVQFSLVGNSVADFRVGTLQVRYQFSGYLQQ